MDFCFWSKISRAYFTFPFLEHFRHMLRGLGRAQSTAPIRGSGYVGWKFHFIFAQFYVVGNMFFVLACTSTMVLLLLLTKLTSSTLKVDRDSVHRRQVKTREYYSWPSRWLSGSVNQIVTDQCTCKLALTSGCYIHSYFYVLLQIPHQINFRMYIPQILLG